jgi:serine protease Do
MAETGNNLSEGPTSAPSHVLGTDIADVVERVSPAVVNIQVSGRKAAAQRQTEQPFGGNIPPQFEPFFRKFYGDEGRGAPKRRQSERQQSGLGSGFIIGKDGDVVTNNHVIDGADEITVVLKDGTRLEATLVGRDPRTDLALLKVKADQPLPYVSFGDSDKMRIGNQIFAVGNPFGLGSTVTTGIVSAHGRSIGAGPYDDFMQIDAAINPGNSGGPAFNLKGKVIGVNTAIFSPSGGNVGIGFAIPSNMARNIIGQLKANGSIERGWLGVEIQEITPKIAQGLGLRRTTGALISMVRDTGPAKTAGLRQGDVVLKVNGVTVKSVRQLPRQIAFIKPGETARLTISRQGKTVEIPVTIGKFPEQVTAAADGDLPAVDHVAVGGLRLAQLDAQVRDQLDLDIDDDVTGVVVVEIDAESDAAASDIRPGDLIRFVGERRVKTLNDVKSAVSAAKKDNQKTILVLISRESHDRFVALQLGAA